MGRSVESSETRYLRAVRLAHGAAFDPIRWPAALEAIADYTGAAGAMFVCHDQAVDNSWIITGRLREDLSRLYMNRYADNVIAREVMRRGPGLYAAHRLTDMDALMHSDFGADIWHPQGICTMLQSAHPAITNNRSSGGFAVSLNCRQTEDLGEAERRWGHLSTQLRLAADLYFAQGQGLRRASERTQILDLLEEPAVLLSLDGLLIGTNRRAEALVEDGKSFRVGRSGAISAVDPEDDGRLRVGLARVRAQGIGTGFRLFSPEGWLAIIAPAPDPVGDCCLTRPALAILRLIDPAADQRRRVQTAVKLFDLSPAEANVLTEIVQGRSAPETARVLKLSPETVRTHLKHIFDKSGVRSQAELGQLVVRLPALTSSLAR